MSDRTYTLKEVVAAIRWLYGRDEAARFARQLRYWTNLGLISPIGKKHTGTGVSRRYSADEVRKAAILAELENYHVPKPVLVEGFAVHARSWVKSPAWRQAVSGSQQVLLYMMYGKPAAIGLGYKFVLGETPLIHLISPKEERASPELRPSRELLSVMPASAIVVNVTRVFARMKL